MCIRDRLISAANSYRFKIRTSLYGRTKCLHTIQFETRFGASVFFGIMLSVVCLLSSFKPFLNCLELYFSTKKLLHWRIKSVFLHFNKSNCRLNHRPTLNINIAFHITAISEVTLLAFPQLCGNYFLKLLMTLYSFSF